MSRKLSRLRVQSPLDIAGRGDVNDSNCFIVSDNNSHSHNSVGFDCTESGFTPSAFFRFLPPVNSYYKALGASYKTIMTYLANVSLERQRRDLTEYACITKDEVGFHEIMVLLRKHKMLKGVQIKEIEKLKFNRPSPWISSEKKAEIWSLLFEYNAQIEIPQGVEWLSIVAHGGKEHICSTFIGERAPYSLKNMIQDNLKRELANYILGFVIAWMIINTIFIFYVNLLR